MWHILRQIVRTGIVTEPMPYLPLPLPLPDNAGDAAQRIHQDF